MAALAPVAPEPPEPLPDPAATSVAALGWMQGFPPPADKLVTFDDPEGSVFPRTRWGYSHVRETVPTANVWRGGGPPSPLPATARELGGIAFCSSEGEPMDFARMLERTYADGILVLHRGQVVYERYFGAL
ncbi:MAG TPA: 6-aminohexanoate hydrolase, partial [Variovorax sp.]